MKILIFCPVSSGGIAEHIHYQARAFKNKNNNVLVLAAEDYLAGRSIQYPLERVFSPETAPVGNQNILKRFKKILCHSWKIVYDQYLFATKIFLHRPDFVLIGWYGEYLSPLWAWPHWVIARFFGIVYAVNIHDPLRNYVVGPRWWHELSVQMAYWPISVGVVHQRLSEPSPVPRHLHVVEAPVGVYDLQESQENPEAIRAAWGVGGRDSEKLKLGKAESENALDAGRSKVDWSAPATSHTPLATPASPEVVFLAFGFIRDNKNLDLLIRALVDCPDAVLVVMGRAQSKKDKPLEFYRNLSAELGVHDQVKFFDGFVPDEKLASYFAAADVVVLNYDKSFHSQSGVLNIAARARRPVLASAGDSPLKDCVKRFRLGVFVEPDDLVAVKEGVAKLINAKCEMRNLVGGEPDWEGYEAFASWDVNVAKILEGVEEVRRNKETPVE